MFVRGKEKWSIVHKLTAREVINLEYDKDCPSFNNLPWSDAYCLQHSVKVLHMHFSCALNNVHRLKVWLQAQEKYNKIASPSIHPQELCDEYPRDIEEIVTYTLPFCGGLSSRSDPQGVDETDGIYS